jgi:glycosyltransferase involved in cell wall biosynthesis
MALEHMGDKTVEHDTDQRCVQGDIELSLCMILKDEAFFLSRCLESVRHYVDEIVLVDTGSSDSTLAICRQYTERVFTFDWVNDFAAARNFSLQQARGKWILVLDADELITPDDLATLRALLSSASEDAFILDQLNYSDDPVERDWQPLNGQQVFGWPYKGYRLNPCARLFRNRQDIHYTGKVHEVIDLREGDLPSRALHIPIHHDINGNPDKDRRRRQLNYLSIMESALAESPDGRLAARAAGVRMYMLQDYTGAVALLEQAISLGYEPQINREALAEAHYRLGDFTAATQGYRALYSEGFATPSLCNNFSNLLVKADDFQTAITVLERALTLGQPAPERIARLRQNIEYLRGQLNQRS